MYFFSAAAKTSPTFSYHIVALTSDSIIESFNFSLHRTAHPRTACRPSMRKCSFYEVGMNQHRRMTTCGDDKKIYAKTSQLSSVVCFVVRCSAGRNDVAREEKTGGGKDVPSNFDMLFTQTTNESHESDGGEAKKKVGKTQFSFFFFATHALQPTLPTPSTNTKLDE